MKNMKNVENSLNSENDNFVIIGKIVASHGVRGDVRILPLTDFPERFFERKNVLFGDEKKMLTIENARWNKNVILIKFQEVENLDDALTLKGQLLYTVIDDVMPLPAGEFYIFELVGLSVYDTDGVYLGVVQEIIQTGSNDVYIVENEKEKPLLIPALKSVVNEINIVDKKITVVPVAIWSE